MERKEQTSKPQVEEAEEIKVEYFGLDTEAFRTVLKTLPQDLLDSIQRQFYIEPNSLAAGAITQDTAKNQPKKSQEETNVEDYLALDESEN